MNDQQFDRFMKLLLLFGLLAVMVVSALIEPCDGACTLAEEATRGL